MKDSPQSTQRGIAATKSEARNPKFETNSNDKNTNDLNEFKNNTGNLLNEISRNCTLVVQRKTFSFAPLVSGANEKVLHEKAEREL
jgi:hypothetical protein